MRVVIVRHGQSTWNAEGRIQGSTNLSVLTDKGKKQAAKARDMLAAYRFTTVFQSPLRRAVQTADIILQGREGGGATEGGGAPPKPERVTLPSLREIDLYKFQGLLKADGKGLYGEQYGRWQRAPAEFELDGHAPVRELWHRASLAWQSILTPERPAQAGPAPASAAGATSSASAAPASAPASAAPSTSGDASAAPCTSAYVSGSHPSSTAPGPGTSASAPTGISTDPRVVLVVAHNAINQALLATALGLPPAYFRRLPQNNAALSVLDFEPGAAHSPPSGASHPPPPPRVTLSCYNQSPDNPFKNPDKVAAHVVLITPPPPPPPLHGQPPSQAGGGGGGQRREEGGALHSLARVLGGLRISHVLAAPSVAPATVDALLALRQQHTQPAAAGSSSALPPQGSPTASSSPPSSPRPSSFSSSSSSEEPRLLSVDEAAASQLRRTVPVEWLPASGSEAEPEAVWQRAVALTLPASSSAATAAADASGGGGGGGGGDDDRNRGTYGNVLVVLDERRHEGALWAALGLPPPRTVGSCGEGVGACGHGGGGDGGSAGGGVGERPRLRVSPGGLSVVEFSTDPRVCPAVVRCVNNTAHLAA